jgi:hypothetical protein
MRYKGGSIWVCLALCLTSIASCQRNSSVTSPSETMRPTSPSTATLNEPVGSADATSNTANAGKSADAERSADAIRTVSYPSTGIEPGDPVVINGAFPEDLPSPDEERRSIAVARNYIERTGNPVSAEYSVRRGRHGFTVFVQFVANDEEGHPRSFPGGHCMIELSEDWQIVQVTNGA